MAAGSVEASAPVVLVVGNVAAVRERLVRVAAARAAA
jgi:hypothetical protein